MLNSVFALDKRLALSNERLRLQVADYENVHALIDNYLADYAAYNQLSAQNIVDTYNTFAKTYSRHLEFFQEKNLYPFEYQDNTRVDRSSYDIALILSCVVSTARFEIIRHLINHINRHAYANIAVVGAGAGIELEVLRQCSLTNNVSAYDLELGSFVKTRFTQFNLKQQTFMSDGEQFDAIIAIEILEHLEAPLQLMHTLFSALNDGGICLCTTATNMPQFDHLVNFTDLNAFKEQLTKIGFAVQDFQEFSQPYPFYGIEGKNSWFVLKK